jgi:hypothetical protein
MKSTTLWKVGLDMRMKTLLVCATLIIWYYLYVVLAGGRSNPMNCIERKIFGIMFWKMFWYEDHNYSCVCNFDILVIIIKI